MPITITGLNFEVTESIRNYIEKKITHLEKYHDRFITLSVELDKNLHHKKGEVFRVRINAQIPQAVLHAEETAVDLYAAIDLAQEELAVLLKKHDDKFEARKRQGRKTRRFLKSIFGMGTNAE